MRSEKTLADFPPEQFTIFGYCACGHSDAIRRYGLRPEMPMDEFKAPLRCGRCGARGIEIRIVYTAAGEYGYW